MAQVKFANNAVSTLAASINTAATSISIAGADAGKFPSLAAGDWHPLTIVDSAGNMEIVKVTARSGSALTVVRAQEGTTAKNFAAGSKADLRLTVAALAEIYAKALGDHTHTISQVTGLQTALDAKTTPSAVATQITTAINALVDAAPGTLDTLNELAAALGDDPNFATTIANQLSAMTASIATKLPELRAFVDLASAATTSIGGAASENVRITGTTTITSFGTATAGTVRRCRFAAALTLKYNATSMILPGDADIAVGADDSIVAISLGSGNWFVASIDFADKTRAQDWLGLTSSIIAALIADLPVGAIGTYGFLYGAPNGAGAGTMWAGSNLRWSNVANSQQGTPSGTWMMLGAGVGAVTGGCTTLFLRVS